MTIIRDVANQMLTLRAGVRYICTSISA